MPSLDQILHVYHELAAWYEQHGPPHVRDRFLILAADAALNAGREDEAERLRQRLLRLNPHHMLRPFTSFAEALRSPDVQNYVGDLKHSYPPEVASQMCDEVEANRLPPEPPAAPAVPATLPLVDLDTAEREPVRERPGPAVVPWDDPPSLPPPKPAPKKRSTAARQPARPTATAQTPAQPAPAAQPGKLARLAAARREAQLAPPEPAASAGPPPAEEEEAPRAAWVASGLFGVVLVAGAGLAVYTVIRPFLPPGWLP